MVWDNSISAADIISVLALLATFITIVLIFIQRHDSAKPILFIRTKNSEENHLELTNYGLDFDLEKSPVEISCFGNNLAKRVSIESYFLLYKSLSFYKTIYIKGGIMTMDVENKPKTFFVVKPSLINFEVINCNETINLNNELRGKLLAMILCGFDALMQHDDKGIPFSKSCIFIKMVYYDMHDKKYTTYAVLSFDFSVFSEEGMHFSFTSKIISKKSFAKYMKLYQEQNCCGWFSSDYVPSYDRKESY